MQRSESLAQGPVLFLLKMMLCVDNHSGPAPCSSDRASTFLPCAHDLPHSWSFFLPAHRGQSHHSARCPSLLSPRPPSQVQAALRVSSLELDPGGTRLIVLANDRAVRVYAMQAPAQGLEALPARDPGEVEALVAAKVRGSGEWSSDGRGQGRCGVGQQHAWPGSRARGDPGGRHAPGPAAAPPLRGPRTSLCMHIVQTRRPSGSIFYEERGALLRPSRRFEQQIERNTWSAATFSGGGSSEGAPLPWAGSLAVSVRAPVCDAGWDSAPGRVPTHPRHDVPFHPKFNADGEYVLAAVAGQTEHVIYAWNSHYGHTDRVLECESGGTGKRSGVGRRQVEEASSRTKCVFTSSLIGRCLKQLSNLSMGAPARRWRMLAPVPLLTRSPPATAPVFSNHPPPPCPSQAYAGRMVFWQWRGILSSTPCSCSHSEAAAASSSGPRWRLACELVLPCYSHVVATVP